jgi:hypothetical protein
MPVSYAMHRIFCAAAGDLEKEREAFYEVMAEFNEAHAMPRNILFIAVALPFHTFDKRPYQAAITENIRACRYYIQVLEDTWGPPEKNFERDHALACKFAADPSLPMQDVAVLFKKPLLPNQVEPAIVEFKRKVAAENAHWDGEFDTIAEYKEQLKRILAKWLETLAPAAVEA